MVSKNSAGSNFMILLFSLVLLRPWPTWTEVGGTVLGTTAFLGQAAWAFPGSGSLLWLKYQCHWAPISPERLPAMFPLGFALPSQTHQTPR